MVIHGVPIENTFAEAFDMCVARVVITAIDARWAHEAALKLTGFATSVIACKCEAAIVREHTPGETPDGRPGVAALLFAMDRDGVAKRLVERIGQTVLTCPTTSCFDGLPDQRDRAAVGRALRVFGDGFQGSKIVGGRRYWRIPVMDGEFLIEDTFGIETTAVGGGNFLILAGTLEDGLRAADAAVEAIRRVPGVILPFPGGVARSGSKIGARQYTNLVASTNDPFCPTLKPLVTSALTEDVNAVFELVLDGLDAGSVSRALADGIESACGPGVLGITAGNYGGRLGQHQFALHALLADRSGAR
jgi:formylmethanofuran--tetrahydromethanopterin N-formyltransferase